MKPSVLVLTEDGGPDGKNAFATIEALTKKLLKYLDHSCDPDKIDFPPLTDEDVRKVLVANAYTSRRDSRRRKLHQMIATQLRLDDGFVVHHFDGDCPWGDRDDEAPLDAKPVQTAIIQHVRIIFEQEGLSSTEIDAMLRRYLRLVPYREIEAWLYQNTEKARTFACGRAQCGCMMKLDQWRADRGLLDEVPKPPAALPCVGKRHNLDLVAGIPVKDVYAAGKSLATALDAMLGCEALLETLQNKDQRTYPSPP